MSRSRDSGFVIFSVQFNLSLLHVYDNCYKFWKKSIVYYNLCISRGDRQPPPKSRPLILPLGYYMLLLFSLKKVLETFNMV